MSRGKDEVRGRISAMAFENWVCAKVVMWSGVRRKLIGRQDVRGTGE